MNQFLVVAFLFAGNAGRFPVGQSGPSASPLSWQVSKAVESVNSQELSPPHDALGVSKEPSSLSIVELHDQRPYGETGQRIVLLARYEFVPIQGPDSIVAAVTLTLACDAGTGDLVCAFTEPAPIWTRPKDYSEIEPQTRRRWKVGPARARELHSTAVEVLQKAWKNWAGDPRKAGQIILRPRLVQDMDTKLDALRKPLPPEPPTNMWIIEVLGSFIEAQYGFPLTTHVMVLRDGDLEFVGGIVLP